MSDDTLTHCAADYNMDRFLNIEEADLQPHLDRINDRTLAETLKHGILDKQPLSAYSRMSHGLPVANYMVIIMGV
jgi:pre-mRNA-splicing helicase BRR2